jgi:hypothetical protein
MTDGYILILSAGLTISSEGKKDDEPFVVDRIIDGFVLRHPGRKICTSGLAISCD